MRPASDPWCAHCHVPEVIRPASAEVDPYVPEATHRVNGRDWRTTCEPSSQTTRCRTEIKATTVTQVKGRFVQKTGWYFNNLTHLPSARSLWKNNPLSYTNKFIAADGRKWRTECDTPATGRNQRRNGQTPGSGHHTHGSHKCRWYSLFVLLHPQSPRSGTLQQPDGVAPVRKQRQ